jgi:hypothetical protein
LHVPLFFYKQVDAHWVGRRSPSCGCFCLLSAALLVYVLFILVR